MSAPASFAAAPSQLSVSRDGWPPLIERLIYYMLLPDLFARVVLEAGLNISALEITQPKLWVLYAAIFVEYVIASLSLGQQRFKLNFSGITFLLLMTMVVHGLCISIYWGNAIPKTLTDTVPVLVTGINVLLLNRENCFKGFNFDRLAKVIFAYSFVMVAVALAAGSIGRNTLVSLGGSGGEPICLTIILVYLARKPVPTVLDLAFVAFVLGPTVPETNRTTLAAFGLAFFVFVIPHIFRSGKQVYFSLLLFGALAVAYILFVPADSKIATRINGLVEHVTSDKSETSGSLAERKAEWDEIQKKEAQLGFAAQVFGYGPGGVYQPQFTMGIPPNYSHAHYSWAFFRLRWGYVGYFYLAAFATLIVINLLSHLPRGDPLSRTISILCMWCIIYMFTYVFFNFLAIGLQFADTRDDPDVALIK